jgi:hypothetical protein
MSVDAYGMCMRNTPTEHLDRDAQFKQMSQPPPPEVGMFLEVVFVFVFLCFGESLPNMLAVTRHFFPRILTPPPPAPHTHTHTHTHTHPLVAEYRFYLSFENIMCDDYVTEKFYRALLRGNVPVVLGTQPPLPLSLSLSLSFPPSALQFLPSKFWLAPKFFPFGPHNATLPATTSTTRRRHHGGPRPVAQVVHRRQRL